MRNKILPGAGPFYYNGNQTGILIFHGFGGGTCSDFKYIAESIFDNKGYTIHIPLLPGFGTTPEDLKQTQVNEWIESIEHSFKVIKQKCEKVIVGGHSGGALLPFLLANSHKIEGIFTISAPIGIRGWGPIIAPFMNLFMKYHKIESDKFKRDTNGKWVGYDKIPINILKKIKKLISKMKDSLANITCPVILFQGRKDNQIKKESMNIIYQNIKSVDKRKVWLENNEHPILDSPDQNIIIGELINFVERIKNRNLNIG
jgi:carboxylesterase